MPKASPRRATNVRHFAINVDNMDRAQRFYKRVFGWTFEAWGPPDFYKIETGTAADPGIFGAMQKRRELVAGERLNAFECSIFVPDVDAVAAAVVANGGTIIMPKAKIPTVGHLIWFRDPEGNVAGAMQPDAATRDDD
jgi:predicted enzyme related to lactoylglutathione lyase